MAVNLLRLGAAFRALDAIDNITEQDGLLHIPVDGSSVFSRVVYAPTTLTLTTTFRRGGRTYRHPGVPPHVVAALAAAASPGEFYNLNIRGRYR